jgi:methylmalonyl-CoA mutase N-terminal domain/subunit
MSLREDAMDRPPYRVDNKAERGQIERVRALRARRDSRRCRAALDNITEQARSNCNLMPAILAAVESFATVGEITQSLRDVFGEYQVTAMR